MSQEGGLREWSCLFLLLNYFKSTPFDFPQPPHVVHSPPVYSAAVLVQCVSHRWLFTALLLTTLLSGHQQQNINFIIVPISIFSFASEGALSAEVQVNI